MNYGISDQHGNQIANGLQEPTVWRVAQREANERGEIVSVWIDGGGEDGPEWEFAPEAQP